MPLINFAGLARIQASPWSSQIIGEVGPARIKVLRMDHQPYEEESHGYNEALIVIEGRLELDVNGEALSVAGGEMYVVAAGTPHRVRPGSHGTLVIVDL
ncbi:MAG: hypothetical protein GAK35_02547 [Herbaspirillum frisingense]|uniref:Cupin type-2 domain-containing protein n=1 Tax=Herbaspirillum frisingense TaxID=92645 RepID=A0A7V8JTN6_9BURK|nr:MAG: hypothetical protein GAK35_02547 [Herbaspirillum frisingense]